MSSHLDRAAVVTAASFADASDRFAADSFVVKFILRASESVGPGDTDCDRKLHGSLPAAIFLVSCMDCRILAFA